MMGVGGCWGGEYGEGDDGKLIERGMWLMEGG